MRERGKLVARIPPSVNNPILICELGDYLVPTELSVAEEEGGGVGGQISRGCASPLLRLGSSLSK